MADEQATAEVIEACPECDESSIYHRKTKSPPYRCRDCDATFDEPVERPRQPNGPAPVSTETCNDAIRRAAEALGEPLGVNDYDEWAREHDAPSGLGISVRDGWPDASLDAGVTPAQRFTHDADALYAALDRVRAEIGHWPSPTEYTDHRTPIEPSETWFYDDDETPDS